MEDEILKAIPQLAKMGWVGLGVGVLMVGLIIYMKIRGKTKRQGKDMKKGGEQAGKEAQSNANDLDETREEVDNFLNRPKR